MTDAMPTPEPPEHTGTNEATFGMKKAAQVAGISVSTIRRNKSRLEECGAEISSDGWKVPMSALVASGLMRRQAPPDIPIEDLKSPQNNSQNPERVHQLEREVLELKHRAELAEERQYSAEQQARAAREFATSLAETLNVERRMLSAGKDHSTEQFRIPSSYPEGKDSQKAEQKVIPSNWWRRLFNI